MSSITNILKKLRESRMNEESISMEFATEADAEEWAAENGYQIDKTQLGRSGKDSIFWMSKIEESEGVQRAFKVGDTAGWSMLYGGSISGKVLSRTEDTLKMEKTWTSEDDGSDVSAVDEYEIEVDDEGSEYIVVWRYSGEEGKVYPPRETMSESVSSDEWEYWEMPKDFKGPWTHPYYSKEYGHDLVGIIYPPYEATSDFLKDMTHYDYAAELYDNNRALTIDMKDFDDMESCKSYLDEIAAYTLDHMNESNTTFKNAGHEWEILDTNGEYTLVFARGKRITPYVVAWKLDPKDNSWAQGHYFDSEKKAREYLATK